MSRYDRQGGGPSGPASDPRRRGPDSRRRRRPSPPVGRGAAAGVGAFVMGYVALFVLKGDEIMSNFWRGFRASGGSMAELESLGISVPEKWKIVGMVYHQLHNSEYEMTIESGARSQTISMGREFMAGDPLPWLVPMVALVVAGFAVAATTRVSGGARGALFGATITIGYAIMMLATAFVFTWSASYSAFGQTISFSIGPSLAQSLLFGGVLYPLLFGAVGGALGAVATRG